MHCGMKASKLWLVEVHYETQNYKNYFVQVYLKNLFNCMIFWKKDFFWKTAKVKILRERNFTGNYWALECQKVNLPCSKVLGYSKSMEWAEKIQCEWKWALLHIDQGDFHQPISYFSRDRLPTQS